MDSQPKKKKSVSSKQDKSQAGSVKSKKQQPPGEILEQQNSQHDIQIDDHPQQHDPFIPSPPQQQIKVCIHHNLPFQFFCEACEDPICQQCTILGPHNTQLHRINRLSDSFKLRCAKIEESIKANLLGKREQLLAQIHRIEYRIEEIKYVKTIIERDARAEFGGVLERLKQSEGQKLAILSHEISELQRDLDKINEVGSSFYDLKEIPDPCPFLLKSRNIYDQIEYMVAKPFKVQIDVYPYDLPRELTELRLQLQKASAQQQLIEFKNEIIWKLLSEKQMDEETIKQELERQASEEINEWSKLVDKFSQELKKQQLVCYYCGCKMEKQYVNSICTQNRQEQDYDKVFCNEQPPQNHHATGRHYFADPIL
ncbi:unnamed protein product [Paramecium sonneborni]|uniref:B box-type domain-containing protein n=1 Tax=Paramecium sonneborni TaxID=65129 RepID=A0A8S1Q980_9CILI|nr:unnamed protein product [Paramecium sonneborni]